MPGSFLILDRHSGFYSKSVSMGSAMQKKKPEDQFWSRAFTHLLCKLSLLLLLSHRGLFNFVPQTDGDPLGVFACCVLERGWKEVKNGLRGSGQHTELDHLACIC